MTAPTTRCSSCATLEIEAVVLRGLLEDEREANIMLQRKIAMIAAAQIPTQENVHAL